MKRFLLGLVAVFALMVSFGFAPKSEAQVSVHVGPTYHHPVYHHYYYHHTYYHHRVYRGGHYRYY